MGALFCSLPLGASLTCSLLLEAEEGETIDVHTCTHHYGSLWHQCGKSQIARPNQEESSAQHLRASSGQHDHGLHLHNSLDQAVIPLIYAQAALRKTCTRLKSASVTTVSGSSWRMPRRWECVLVMDHHE